MTNAELLAKIKAEIKRRKNNAETLRERNICIDILSFLDILEKSDKPFKKPIDGILYAAACGIKNKEQIEESEMPVPQDLEVYAQNIEDYHDVGDERGYLYTNRGDIKDAVIAGAKWQKEQMMSGAVEGVVFGNVYEHWVETGIVEELAYLNPGDKVRVIVLPKED